MKKATIFLLSLGVLISFTQCNNAAPEKLCDNAASRVKVISSLMNNDAYMTEVMDSMRTKHPDVMLTTVFVIAKNDKAMQGHMMDKMTDMCKMDTSMSMTKMVVGKTMKMLDECNLDCCTTGKMMMGDDQAMQHGDQSDCCKKGKMIMGKKGEMTAADKLACCMAASKK